MRNTCKTINPLLKYSPYITQFKKIDIELSETLREKSITLGQRAIPM